MGADKNGMFNYAGLTESGIWQNFQVDHPKEATTEETGYEAISRQFDNLKEAELFCEGQNA